MRIKREPPAAKLHEILRDNPKAFAEEHRDRIPKMSLSGTTHNHWKPYLCSNQFSRESPFKEG
jgi:hypothetical protein